MIFETRLEPGTLAIVIPWSLIASSIIGAYCMVDDPFLRLLGALGTFKVAMLIGMIGRMYVERNRIDFCSLRCSISKRRYSEIQNRPRPRMRSPSLRLRFNKTTPTRLLSKSSHTQPSTHRAKGIKYQTTCKKMGSRIPSTRLQHYSINPCSWSRWSSRLFKLPNTLIQNRLYQQKSSDFRQAPNI
jgi:hypothetical protein